MTSLNVKLLNFEHLAKIILTLDMQSCAVLYRTLRKKKHIFVPLVY